MGKIVRSAAFTDTAYVVAVPRIEDAAPAPAREQRFGDPFGDRNAQAFAAHAFGEAPASSPLEPASASAPASEATVDWDAVRADADSVIDRALADAEALLAQAERAALALVEGARGEVAEIEAQARERGMAEGREAAQTAARAEVEPELATLRELAASLRQQRHAIFDTAVPEIVRLALDVAERVVHTEVAENANVVVENVRQALTRLLAREVVTLRINPADMEAIRGNRDALVAAADIEHLRIIEDQRVDRGGVLVETESGTIDAKIATQLREARRAILSDDSIALGPSADDELHPPAQAS
ncbi:MAG: hypothetical protein KGN02_07980 [bacterium]|nr:hypothetical protein [bacterium]